MFPELITWNPHCFFKNEDEFKSQMSIVRGFILKNVLVGMHAQEFVEINIVVGGSGAHYIENRRLLAEPGDVFFILPEYTHGYAGDDSFEVFNLTIHKRFLDKNLTELQSIPAFSVLFQAEPLLRTSQAKPLHLKLESGQLNSISGLMKEIIQYSESNDTTQALICNHLAAILIAQLCAFYVQNTKDTDWQTLRGDQAFLHVLSHIHEHYSERIEVADMAEIAHISRGSLIRRFREVCGMSPHKYLNRQRIEIAAHYLENTELTLSEIAERTGFYDAAHLSRIFQTEMGAAPASYRKRHQGNGM